MRHRRLRTIAASVLVVVLAMLLGWVLTRDQGPRFRGQPASHWFPRLESGAKFDPTDDLAAAARQKDRSAVIETLAQGGPEVVPLLLAVSRIEDGRLARRYQRLHPRLPKLISRSLPVMRYAASMQSEVAEVIWKMPVAENTCHALTNALPDFPEFLQVQVVRWMTRTSGQESIVVPCLVRSIQGTNDAVAIAAAQTLLALPRARLEQAEGIIRALSRRPESVWTNRWALAPVALSIEFTQLGVRAVGAEDWMQRWLASSNSQLRACAAVTLPAVAPSRYPLAETFVSVLSGLTAGDIRTALNANRLLNTRDELDWLDLTVALAPLLDPSFSGTHEIRGHTVRLAAPARSAVVYGVLDLAEVLGPEAAPLAGILAKSLAGMEPRTLGAKTARILARLGPVVPETIPDLLPGLNHLATAPTMVLLLASYGNQAKMAAPRLREMAEGRLGFNGSDRPPLAPALARRYGLRVLPPELTKNGVVAVWPDLALSLGLTNCWPLPSEARDRASLVWSSASAVAEEGEPSQTPPENAFSLPPVSLSDLAAEALRRIEH
jgi:hypothetical protein